MKSDKLEKTDRFDNAEERWIKKTGYKVRFWSVSENLLHLDNHSETSFINLN
jgi:hypothetical protein